MKAARTIARHLVEAHGVATDLAIHRPGKAGDERNFHCHLMMTTRRLGPKGMGEKSREWDELKAGAALAKDMRAIIAATLNAELKAEGKAGVVFVEHRSFKARGSGQVATRHQGPSRTNAQRKRQGKERQAWEREQRSAQAVRHGKELAGLKAKHDFAFQAKAGELAERQRIGEAAIRRDLAAQHQADQVKRETGIRGLFRKLTGRAGREAFEQLTREAQREEGARQRIETLTAGLRQERAAFITDQAKDHGRMIERHSQEDAQLRTAFEHRHQTDRLAEVQTRKVEVQGLENERQEQSRGGRSIGQALRL